MAYSQEEVKWNFQNRVFGKEKNQEMPGDMKDAGWVVQDSIYISRNGLI